MPLANILYVEDDPLMVSLVARALEKHGHHVRHAETAEEGLQHAQDQLPALVLVDLWLPGGMDGWELITALRERYGDALPILVVSAQNSAEARQRAYNMGGNDYLPKPFEIPTLLATVEALLA